MIKITILDRLSEKALRDNAGESRLISMRKLTRKEIGLARRKGLRRYYLPGLSQNNIREFYEEFDKFWDGAVQSFPVDHFFWRNAVSSKMQEWERSLSYFALILFTLSHDPYAYEDTRLIFICASLQEEDVLRDWAGRYGWPVTYYKRADFRWFRAFIQEAWNNVRFARFSAVCLYRKLMAFRTRVNLSYDDKRSAVLITSLFYPYSFFGGKYTDPFFGDFHKYLEKKGFRCLYLCDSLNRPDFRLKQSISRCRDSEVIGTYSLLSVRKLVAVMSRIFFRKFKFIKSEFMGIDFSGLIIWNARRFSDYWNIFAEIFFEATKKLCQKIKFSQLLHIYEGYVFERACTQAFRQFSSGKIVGYNHCSLDRLNLNLRLTANEALAKPEPDRYICTSSYAKKLLAEIGERDPAKISAGCFLRGIPAISSFQGPLDTGKQILIALDGMWNSVNILDWIFEHAVIFQDFQVRIRAHPNVPFEKLKEQCLHFMPEYFEVSSGSLKEDLERSFCVIYRQSSVGIQALANNIPVIHLAVDLPLPGDPIEELTAGKWVAKTPQELKVALETIKSLDLQARQALLKEAKKFAADYFSNPTEDRLQDFLEISAG